MKKRIVSALSLSVIFPLAGFVNLAMKLTGEYRWHTTGILYAIGWLCLVIAIRKHRRSRVILKVEKKKLTSLLRERLKFIWIFIGSLTLVYLAWVLFPPGTPPLIEQIDNDLVMVRIYAAGIDNTLVDLEKTRELLTDDVASLSPEKRKHLLQLWSRYLAYSMELDRLKHIHGQFFRINFLRYPEANLKSFLVAYSAFVANFSNTLKLTNIVQNKVYLETFLNERRDNLDIPANALLALKQSVTIPDNIIRLNAGQAHLRLPAHSKILRELDVSDLITRAEDEYKTIMKLLGKQPDLFAETPKNVFEKITFIAWFPLQKGVAEGMSLVRTVHRENFITLKDVRLAMKDLEPGDILLERKNWYLTNVGIPGFWPHTALYTGTMKEMDAYFKDEDIPGASSASEYIKKHYPKLYGKISGKTKKGFEYRVFEALAPGIIPTAFEVSGRADYLSALRPRLTRAEKLRAILKAFSFYNRPYDYNFDFITDNELVCSELIFKAYEPGEKQTGVNFSLTETAGRLMLPPNDIAKKFDTELGKETAQLDFVMFLDGSEKEQKAVRKDVNAFRKSYKRPKWDIMQR
ncbi:MAG: hypothetical protein KAH23_07980 [Kiritimatiellae bacterium]|nr:hypothetical protein [Kiritimatiellia bacterium]